MEYVEGALNCFQDHRESCFSVTGFDATVVRQTISCRGHKRLEQFFIDDAILKPETCLARASNGELAVEVGSPSSVKERWVYSDGSFEFLKILGRLYIRELGLYVLDPLVEL